MRFLRIDTLTFYSVPQHPPTPILRPPTLAAALHTLVQRAPRSRHNVPRRSTNATRWSCLRRMVLFPSHMERTADTYGGCAVAYGHLRYLSQSVHPDQMQQQVTAVVPPADQQQQQRRHPSSSGRSQRSRRSRRSRSRSLPGSEDARGRVRWKTLDKEEGHDRTSR